MRKGKTRNYSYFVETSEELGVGFGQLSEALGYNENTWHRWKKYGEMPAVAGLACECLRRRQKKGVGEKDTFMLTVSHKHVEVFETFCKGLDIAATKVLTS